MSYYVSLAYKLDTDDRTVVYDRTDFAGKPILISTPELSQSLDEFVRALTIVPLVYADTADGKGDGFKSNENSGYKRIALAEGQAYVQQLKSLPKQSLDELCNGITIFLHDWAHRLPEVGSGDKILEVSASGAIEAAELIVFLKRYARSKKRIHRESYLFIMKG